MLGFGDQIWLLLFGGDQILHVPTQWQAKFLIQIWKYMREKKNILDSVLASSFSFGFCVFFVSFVAHLQPLHKTLSELRWLKLG